MPTFAGTAGDDTLTGTSGNDTFDLSLGGSDTVTGLAGDDTFILGAACQPGDQIDGGSGYDTIILNDNYATIFSPALLVNIEKILLTAGHTYNLEIWNNASPSSTVLIIDGSTLGATDNLYFQLQGLTSYRVAVLGGAADDTIGAPSPNGNSYDGGGGIDYWRYRGDLSFAPHNLAINLAAGTISDGTNTDTIANFESVSGGYGDDIITGDAGDNWLSGGGGRDTIEGGLGNDTLAGSGNATLTYTHSPGAVFVDAGHGVAWGGEDFDTVSGFTTIVGSAYNDTMVGSSVGLGAYHFVGGDGNDTLLVGDPWWIPFSTPVASTLEGGNGCDTLAGSHGDDLIIGGADADIMTGGGGQDVFRFEALPDIASDHITDFTRYDDKLDFSAIAGLAFIGSAAFTGAAGQMRYRFADGCTVMEVDTNGDGTADRSLTLDSGEFALAETSAGSRVLSVADAVAPTLVSVEHLDWWDADWQQPSYPTAVFKLTFSEPVVLGSGKIEIYQADGTLVGTGTLSMLGGTVLGGEIVGNTVTVYNFARLTTSTAYYVVVPAGSFKDKYGNDFAGTSAQTAYAFTTQASHTVQRPFVVSVAPSVMPVDGAVTVTFDNPVTVGTGYVYLSAAVMFEVGPFFRYVTDTIYRIDITDTSQVTISGNTVTIKPSQILPSNLPISVKIISGALLDGDGRPQTVDEQVLRTATVADTTQPLLVSAVFGDGSANAPQNGNLVLTFNETIRDGVWGQAGSYVWGTLDRAGAIAIYRSDGTLVAIYDHNDPSEYSISGSTLTINPVLDLPADTDFYVEVGAFAVEDYVGNFFGGTNYANAASSAPFRVLTFHTSSTIDGTGNNDILPGTSASDAIRGFAGNDTLLGGDEHDTLTGGAGNDTLDGGSNIDTAVFAGNFAAYTITQGATGVFTVSGSDGTDTLSNVEYAKFDDQIVRLLPGTGTTIDWNADPSTYMAGIRDFDGNDVGAASGWKLIGTADVNGDGTVEHILVNRQNGRWAEVGTEADGKNYLSNYGWAGDTRVVGIYIDPLVTSGEVVAGSDFDSQRRFQNDLNIENIHGVLGQADYNHDGLQEIYFSLTDGTAYLHAYMHADGNIQYANYQNEQQVKDYLTANGFTSAAWAGWFPVAQSALATVAG